MFESDELRKLLDLADMQMKAMILLSLNCGFGNKDIGELPIAAVSMDTGSIDFPRPKTAIERRCPLWTESIDALRKVLAERPTPKESAAKNKVFVTKYGGAWSKTGDAEKARSDNPISAEFRKLLKTCDLCRKGRGFYSLRHVFETIGGETKDHVAVNSIMGHVDDSMAATYREHISDERLIAVTDFVHDWLFEAQE